MIESPQAGAIYSCMIAAGSCLVPAVRGSDDVFGVYALLSRPRSDGNDSDNLQGIDMKIWDFIDDPRLVKRMTNLLVLTGMGLLIAIIVGLVLAVFYIIVG
ncbi:MAG: hypothetical protein LBL48_02475 [Azoarcus sp.]|nr:hypothetical protein [Azoarcus sp.]